MSGGYIRFPELLSLIGDRSGIWTQIHLTSNPELLESTTLCLSHHPPWLQWNEASWEVFPPFAFPSWRMSRFCSFFLFPPCFPFIHRNRKKCLLCARWCDWHWLNFVQRKRSRWKKTDPRIHSQTQGQRCSKKVPTVFMFVFLFFLFLLAAPCLMQNLISPTRSRTCVPSLEAPSLNDWTAREVPVYFLLQT